MFCPKCGSQNSDETKFCRGCGSDVSNVLAVVDRRQVGNIPALAEKHIELFSSGLRGLLVGSGFIIVAAVALGISTRMAVLAIFALAFASYFVGAGISRLVQARALKQLRTPKGDDSPQTLSAGDPEYLKPSRSAYETEDLITPRSVTEATTTHLTIDRDSAKRE